MIGKEWRPSIRNFIALYFWTICLLYFYINILNWKKLLFAFGFLSNFNQTWFDWLTFVLTINAKELGLVTLSNVLWNTYLKIRSNSQLNVWITIRSMALETPSKRTFFYRTINWVLIYKVRIPRRKNNFLLICFIEVYHNICCWISYLTK